MWSAALDKNKNKNKITINHQKSWTAAVRHGYANMGMCALRMHTQTHTDTHKLTQTHTNTHECVRCICIHKHTQIRQDLGAHTGALRWGWCIFYF